MYDNKKCREKKESERRKKKRNGKKARNIKMNMKRIHK